MGLKEVIASVTTKTDFPICVTEELLQVKQVEGFKQKRLLTLCNAFGKIGYKPVLAFHGLHSPDWTLNKAGQLRHHVALLATIPLLLVPFNAESDTPVPLVLTEEASVENGKKAIGITKYDKLHKQHPNDTLALCEFLGRLRHVYPEAEQWAWYLCPRAGTTLNFHIQPTNKIDPSLCLHIQKQCTIARIQSINIYPYTIEVVFHAYTKIQRLPYNREHRANRFNPY